MGAGLVDGALEFVLWVRKVYYVVIMFVILIYNGGISIQSVTIHVVLFGYAYLTGCKGAITSDALAAAAVAPF